ncbi:CHAP domain-containing protein, partial [Staphylococcus capitis]|nr:CHAP domain-containing protein [Staphylococcus capitis]
MEPGCIDVDRSFHAQCMDLVIDYCLWISDNQFRIRGNAKQAIDNPLPKGWKIIRNERATVPKQGWIGVNTSTYYGHIWLVDKGATQMTMPVIEQNWNSLANLKPKRRLDYYYGCTHFIVPPISSNNAIVRAAKNVLPSPKPMKVLLVAGHGKGAYSNDPGVVNT